MTKENGQTKNESRRAIAPPLPQSIDQRRERIDRLGASAMAALSSVSVGDRRIVEPEFDAQDHELALQPRQHARARLPRRRS